MEDQGGHSVHCGEKIPARVCIFAKRLNYDSTLIQKTNITTTDFKFMSSVS